MRERKYFADRLRPVRHAAKWEHEPREEYGRKKDKERHLHRLKLIARDGGDGDAHREVRGDKHQRDDTEQRDAAVHRYVKQEVRGDEDDGDLDITDEYVWDDFSDEHLAG